MKIIDRDKQTYKTIYKQRYKPISTKEKLEYWYINLINNLYLHIVYTISIGLLLVTVFAALDIVSMNKLYSIAHENYVREQQIKHITLNIDSMKQELISLSTPSGLRDEMKGFEHNNDIKYVK